MMNDSGATVVVGSGQPQPHVQAQTVVAGAPVNNNQGCGDGFYPQYRSNWARGLGGLQGLFATLSIIFNIALLAGQDPIYDVLRLNYDENGYGIWTAIIWVVTGSMLVTSARRRSATSIIAALVGSCVAVVSCCWFLAMATDDWYRVGGDVALDLGLALRWEDVLMLLMIVIGSLQLVDVVAAAALGFYTIFFTQKKAFLSEVALAVVNQPQVVQPVVFGVGTAQLQTVAAPGQTMYTASSAQYVQQSNPAQTQPFTSIQPKPDY